ncbi:hypothetical protein Tco_0720292 [Tanacetum coccineum]
MCARSLRPIFLLIALTSKVFSFMVKKGKHFSGKVTPLFSNMLVQPTEDEGEQSERPSEPQLTPSPPHPSEVHVEPSLTHPLDLHLLLIFLILFQRILVGIMDVQSSSDRTPFSGMRGGKPAKQNLPVHKDSLVLNELVDDTLDYMDTKNAQDMGSTDKEKVSHTKEKDRPQDCKEKDSTDRPIRSQSKFSREKEKGVELKDVVNIERPRPTSKRSLLTLKPLPKIDPKDKGKKKIKEDESNTESEDINETKKKFKMLAPDERLQEEMQEDWLQEEEREQFTMEERAKFLHDTIAAQRRFLAEQRAIAIRNRPPTRTQLRNQMMTYLKHVGNKKHSDLKNKTFKEIQALYEKVKRFDESFTAVGSTEDERKIKEMNEGAKDLEQKRLKKKVAKETPKKEDTAKVPARERKRPQSDVDSDDEPHKVSKDCLHFGRVLNSPCFMVKSWLVQDQIVHGKDYLNLLIAGSLLKTIWFINAPCYGNEALASPKANELTMPEQTATSKGISNPFMAGSLPKTTKPT